MFVLYRATGMFIQVTPFARPLPPNPHPLPSSPPPPFHTPRVGLAVRRPFFFFFFFFLLLVGVRLHQLRKDNDLPANAAVHPRASHARAELTLRVTDVPTQAWSESPVPLRTSGPLA